MNREEPSAPVPQRDKQAEEDLCGAVSRIRDSLRLHLPRQIADTVDSDDAAVLEDGSHAHFI